MSYLVELIEHKGETFLPIPTISYHKELMKNMDWKVGDKVDVNYSKKLDGIVVKRIS